MARRELGDVVRGSTENDLLKLVRDLGGSGPSDAVLGIGDDAAVLAIPAGHQLVCSTDTLVEGVHFLADTCAADLGHKSLAVNLSDLAAMGATARWVLLSITLPSGDAAWMKEFLGAFLGLARQYSVSLVGGDISRGPRSVTVEALGVVEENRYLARGNARCGDLVAVSGYLGDAGLALRRLRAQSKPDAALLERLDRPQPRLDLGRALLGIASSCIDLSDGLLLDLERLLFGTTFGATIYLDKLPTSRWLSDLPEKNRWPLQVAAGDDYELCFTVPATSESSLSKISERTGVELSVIGEVTDDPVIRCLDADGREFDCPQTGYEHFSGRS